MRARRTSLLRMRTLHALEYRSAGDYYNTERINRESFHLVKYQMAVKLFPGLAQKIAPIFIILTAIAWFLIVVGFGIGSSKVEKVKDGDEAPDIFTLPKSFNDRAESQSYPFWMAIFSGVSVIIAALLHAAFWKPFSMFFGAITAFLSVLFLTALGMILYNNGYLIHDANEDDDDIPGWFALEFAGAFLAVLSWIPVMVLWSFYDVEVTFRKA